MTSFTNTTRNYPTGADTPIHRVKVNRPPTTSDRKNFILGDEWLDTSASNWWKLVTITANSAVWKRFANAALDINTITGDSGGAVGPDASNNLNLLGTAGQITVTGNPGTSTLTLALANGGTPIDSITVDAATGPGTNPVVSTGAGAITITGAQVATGTVGANVIRTDSLAANSLTIEVQRSTAVAATDSTKNGVSHFNSAMFSVDASGFVSLSGGGQAIDSFIPDSGTNPVVPTAAGAVTMTGGNGIATVGGTNQLTFDMESPFTGDFSFQSTTSGDTETLTVTNTSNTASSQAQINAVVAGTSAGDAWNQWTIGSSRSYALGPDTSDGSANAKLKLNTATSATVSPSSGTNLFYHDPTPDAAAIPLTPRSVFSNVNFFGVETTSAGQQIRISCTQSDFANPASSAGVEARVAGAVGSVTGDAFMRTVGNLDWVWGEDATNPAAPVFRFGHGGTPRSMTRFYSISTAGQITFGNESSPGNFYSFPLTDGSAGQTLVTNGAGVLTFQNSGSTGWTAISANQTLAVNEGYLCTGGAALSLALPAVSAVGDEIEVALNGSTSWTITQPNAGTQIRIGTSTTTLGVGGSLASTNQGDSIKLVCVTANATWMVVSVVGNITVV